MRRVCMLVLLGALTTGVALSTMQWVMPGVAAVHAQEDPADDGAGPPGRSMLQSVIDGGPPEFVIILMSIVALALIIEHSVSIKREKLAPEHLRHSLEDMFQDEEGVDADLIDEAINLCERDPSFLGSVVAAGLLKLEAGPDRVMMAVANKTEEEATTLHQKISYLSLIASVAPMMGLLGTVMGMITAFNKIAALQGAANPADLAQGIGQALITTLSGLIVAIPVLCAYLFFRNRVVKVVQEVEGTTTDLMDHLTEQHD